MDAARTTPWFAVGPLRRSDLGEVVRIDALHRGAREPGYWREVFRGAFSRREGRARVALAARTSARGGRLAAYLLGDVRAFEFGSEPCGWVFAVGVDPAHARRGAAGALLEEALRRFDAAGIRRVRTMVRRNDVPVLSFFRSSGFVAGPFVQLERGPESGEEES